MTSAPEIQEDSGFQRKQLVAARAAVALFAVVIGLALLGVFGSGPLSHATAGGERDDFTVDYQRFLRFHHDTEVEVRLGAGEGPTTVAIDRGYLDGFEVGGVLPEPDSQTAREGRLLLTFEESRPSAVTIDLVPRKVGLQRAGVSVDDGEEVSFRQMVYP